MARHIRFLLHSFFYRLLHFAPLFSCWSLVGVRAAPRLTIRCHHFRCSHPICAPIALNVTSSVSWPAYANINIRTGLDWTGPDRTHNRCKKRPNNQTITYVYNNDDPAYTYDHSIYVYSFVCEKEIPGMVTGITHVLSTSQPIAITSYQIPFSILCERNLKLCTYI